MVFYARLSMRTPSNGVWIYPPLYTLDGYRENLVPFINYQMPSSGVSCADPDVQITVDILDDSLVKQTTLDAYVEGNWAYKGASDSFVAPYNGGASAVTPLSVGEYDGYRLIIDKTSSYSGSITVRVLADDAYGNSVDQSWSFTPDTTAPYLTDINPDETWVCPTALITYDILDVCAGVKENTLDAYVDGYWALRKGVFADAYDGALSLITPISVGGQDGYEVVIDNTSTYANTPVIVDAYGDDGYGNSLWDTWYFFVDYVPPSIDGYDPASGATNQWSNTAITFNVKDVQTGISQSSIDAYVGDSWVYDGSTDTFKSPYDTSSTITPVSDGYQLYLVNDNEDYTGTVEVDAYAADVCGNARSPSSWSFSIDAIDPYLDGYTPAAGTTAESNSLIVITMKDDETAVDPTSIDAYVDGTWAYDGATDTFKSTFGGASSELTSVTDGYKLTLHNTTFYKSSPVSVQIYFTDRGSNTVTDSWDWSIEVPTVLFYAPLTVSGVQNLPADITINSTTVSPTCRYVGGDATATTWNADGYGENLGYNNLGANITAGQGSPCFGSDDDDSALYASGDCHEASDTAHNQITTEDFYMELLVKMSSSGNKGIVSKGQGTTVNPGFLIWQSVGNPKLRISDGSSLANVTGAKVSTEGSPADGTWAFISIFADRNDDAVVMQTGEVGSYVDISGLGSLTNTDEFQIGADDDLIQFDNKVAYYAMYKSAGWFAGGSTNETQWEAFHKERLAKLAGVYPETATGTATPEMSRASDKHLVHKKSGSLVKYLVSDNWPRVCWFEDEAGDDAYGLLVSDADSIYYKMDDGNMNSDGYGTFEFKEITADQDRSTDGYMLILNDGGAGDEVSVIQNDDNFCVALGMGASIVGSTDIVDGYQHTVRLVVKPNDYWLFNDGSSEGSDSSCDLPADVDRMYMGGTTEDESCDGYLSEIKVWDGYYSP